MTHIVSGVSAYDRKRWKVTLDEGAVTFLLYRGEMNQAGIRLPRELPGGEIPLVNGRGEKMPFPAARRTVPEPDPYTAPRSMARESDSYTAPRSMARESDSYTAPYSTAAEPARHTAPDRKPVEAVPDGTGRNTPAFSAQEHQIQEITEEQWQRIREEILLPRAKKRALFYLKNGDRSEFQIRSRLKEGFYPPEIIEEVMAFLKKYRLADDARLTENYVNQLKTTKSRREIEAKLYAKGLKGDTVKESLAELPGEDEYAAAEKALAKRHTGDRRKDYAYLARRGFSGDSITHAFEALKELYASLPEEDDF